MDLRDFLPLDLLDLFASFLDPLVSFLDLLLSFLDLLVSFLDLLVSFSDLLVSLTDLLVSFSDLFLLLCRRFFPAPLPLPLLLSGELELEEVSLLDLVAKGATGACTGIIIRGICMPFPGPKGPENMAQKVGRLTHPGSYADRPPTQPLLIFAA